MPGCRRPHVGTNGVVGDIDLLARYEIQSTFAREVFVGAAGSAESHRKAAADALNSFVLPRVTNCVSVLVTTTMALAIVAPLASAVPTRVAVLKSCAGALEASTNVVKANIRTAGLRNWIFHIFLPEALRGFITEPGVSYPHFEM
jgi:hypothetical protein